MKNFIYLCIVFISLKISAQCTETANGFGNNSNITSYNISGTVQVKLESSTTISVILGNNFATASGPDVRVYLVKRGNLTTAQLKMPGMFMAAEKIEMGLVTGNTASLPKTFTMTIPNGVNISDYETVYFYCQQFSQFWDFGSFSKFTPTTCASVLSNENFALENVIKIYPNPSNAEVNFSKIADKILIYNSLGEIIISTEKTNQLNVGTLLAGVYFCEVVIGDQKTVKKILKI